MLTMVYLAVAVARGGGGADGEAAEIQLLLFLAVRQLATMGGVGKASFWHGFRPEGQHTGTQEKPVQVLWLKEALAVVWSDSGDMPPSRRFLALRFVLGVAASAPTPQVPPTLQVLSKVPPPPCMSSHANWVASTCVAANFSSSDQFLHIRSIRELCTLSLYPELQGRRDRWNASV